jgi:predicted alpha/beta-hydrolase family hydrolase
MPEVIFNGPAGRLEGRYQPGKEKNAPIAIVLHPHPQFGGTMNNQIVYQLFYMFQQRGFTTLRFNFRRSAAARANSTMAPANCPTPPARSTGCRACIPIPRAAGSPAIPSAPGSACSC